MTPQILAELSNHTFDNIAQPGFGIYIKNLIAIMKAAREDHTYKDALIGNIYLAKLGFTDVSIIESAKRLGYAVLTVDGELYGILQSQGLAAVNLNYIRTQKLLAR